MHPRVQIRRGLRVVDGVPPRVALAQCDEVVVEIAANGGKRFVLPLIAGRHKKLDREYSVREGTDDGNRNPVIPPTVVTGAKPQFQMRASKIDCALVPVPRVRRARRAEPGGG